MFSFDEVKINYCCCWCSLNDAIKSGSSHRKGQRLDNKVTTSHNFFFEKKAP